MKRARRGKEAIAEKKNYLFISLLNMDKFREISELNLFFSYRHIKGYAQLSAEVIEGIDKNKSKKFSKLIDIYLWGLGRLEDETSKSQTSLSETA